MAELFTEKRHENRLPFHEKAIFATYKECVTAYSVNISRGGIFLATLSPFPLDTIGNVLFFLPNQETSFCAKAKVRHIVFDRSRCDVECGMGLEFQELNESQKALLNLHILNEESLYTELKNILNSEELPDQSKINNYLRLLPFLKVNDLFELKYKVNRICTIFEPKDQNLKSTTENRCA